MGLSSRGGGGFISEMGRSFGTQQVVVIHNPGQEDEIRHEVEAHVQSSKAFFNVDAPVYEEDVLEMSDPRGGIRRVYVTEVKINQAGGGMSDMSHISASFASTPPRRSEPRGPSQIIHGNAVIVSGSHVNVALDNGTINQQVPVTHGYEDLARVVGRALELIEATRTVDPDDREAAQEAGTALLTEVVKPEPNRPLIKRSLALLRGVLQGAAAGGAGAAAKGLIEQLFV